MFNKGLEIKFHFKALRDRGQPERARTNTMLMCWFGAFKRNVFTFAGAFRGKLSIYLSHCCGQASVSQTLSSTRQHTGCLSLLQLWFYWSFSARLISESPCSFGLLSNVKATREVLRFLCPFYNNWDTWNGV